MTTLKNIDLTLDIFYKKKDIPKISLGDKVKITIYLELPKEVAEGDKIVGPLLNIISMICHDIYGPAAKQCYDITSNTSAFINFINNHTSSYLCHEMHVC